MTWQTFAKLPQPFPRVQPRLMAVRPMNTHRVRPHELHPLDRDLFRDGCRVQNPGAGPFIHALGALTFAAEEAEREPVLPVGPRHPQYPLVAEGV